MKKRNEYSEKALAHYRVLVDSVARYNGIATIYVVSRGVSRSGMTRRIALRGFNPEGQVYNLSMLAEAFAGYRLDKDGSVVVKGCGFDAGFAVVDHIAYTLKEKHGMDIILRHQWL